MRTGGSWGLQEPPGGSRALLPPLWQLPYSRRVAKNATLPSRLAFFRPLPQSSCRVAAELQKIQLCLVCTGLVCLCVRGLCVCGLCVCVESVCVPGPFRLVLDGGSWGLLRGRGPDSGPRLLQRRGHLATGVGVFVSTGFACLCTGLVCLCVRDLCGLGLCVCVYGVCVPEPFRLVFNEVKRPRAPFRLVFYEVKRPGGRSDSFFTR